MTGDPLVESRDRVDARSGSSECTVPDLRETHDLRLREQLGDASAVRVGHVVRVTAGEEQRLYEVQLADGDDAWRGLAPLRLPQVVSTATTSVWSATGRGRCAASRG